MESQYGILATIAFLWSFYIDSNGAHAESSNFTNGIQIALQKSSVALPRLVTRALPSRLAINKNDILEVTKSRWRWALCLTDMFPCYWQVGVGGKLSGEIDHLLNNKSSL